MIADRLFELLKKRNEKIVFAESCTGGNIAAEMTLIPGISECFCGSFVTYRASQKVAILGVAQDMIDEYTTESVHVVMMMAQNALKLSPEADWAAAIVGHLGPNAPPKKDGKIYIHICGKSNGPTTTVVEELGAIDRIDRLDEATTLLLKLVVELLEAQNE